MSEKTIQMRPDVPAGLVFFEAQEKRFNRFTELLLKVWKVSDDNGPFCYLYPYRAIKSNHCVFCLKSNIPKGDYIQYSGIEEFTIHTDDWCLYPDIEFTESTMGEMIEHANRANDIIVHNRIVKLKERGIITDDLKPTGNVESEGDVPAKTD